MKTAVGASFRGSSLCVKEKEVAKISRIFKDIARPMIQSVVKFIKEDKKQREQMNWDKMVQLSPDDKETGMVGNDLQRLSAFKKMSQAE